MEINNYDYIHHSSLSGGTDVSGPPLNLMANVVDSKTVTLSWDPPLEENRNGIIRSYTVHVTDKLMNENTTYSSDTTNITLTSLRPYSVYLFAVAADTTSFPGPYSSPFLFQMPEAGTHAWVLFLQVYNVCTFNSMLQLQLVLHRIYKYQIPVQLVQL